MISAELLKQPTHRSIHFIEENEVRELVESLEHTDFLLRQFSGSKLDSKQDLFRKFADIFEFPDYFGHNWDALDECLADLEWLPASGYILVLHDAADLWRNHYRIAGRLVDVWLTAAEEWGKRQIPFHLLFVWPSKTDSLED